MRVPTVLVSLLAICLSSVSASVFLPTGQTTAGGPSFASRNSISTNLYNNNNKRSSNFELYRERAMRLRRTSAGHSAVAMAIPGYGITEQVFVGGFMNFLSIYNIVITARILLSWFPQAQGVAILEPIYAVTDPFLNLFRGIIPPIFGLDLSPIAAFFLLNVLSNATAAVGAELKPEIKKKLKNHNPFAPKPSKHIAF